MKVMVIGIGEMIVGIGIGIGYVFELVEFYFPCIRVSELLFYIIIIDFLKKNNNNWYDSFNYY